MENLTELTPIYSNSKSFYRKAMIKKIGKKSVLFSYGKKIAVIDGKKAVVYSIDSNTTLRHLKEFLLQAGFKAENKRQVIDDYKI